MIKVACYIRVSTAEQSLHGLSLDAQKAALTEYANKHNMQIVDFYADEGITARKQLNKRLEFQRLMRDVENDKIDLILVTKLDRWFRNIKDYYNTQDILEKHNCNWRTIFESYDTSTSSGRLHINIMLSVNQDECDRTSERIKAVFKHKLENKEVLSGSVPLGYMIESKHLVKNPATAPMVDFIFNHFELHNNKSKLLADFNTEFNCNYNYNSINNILKNTIYKGVYNGITEYCEPYIDVARFERIQELSKRNIKKRDNNRVYVYSSLLHCELCGRSLIGTTQIKNDKEYKTYRLNQVHARGCLSCRKSINERKIDKYIIEHLKAELSQYKASYDVSVKQTNNNAKIKTLNNKIKRLKDLYINELIELDEYKNDLNKYKSELEKLEDKPQECNIDAINQLLQLDIAELWQELTLSEKQALSRSVIKSITVNNGAIVGIEFI